MPIWSRKENKRTRKVKNQKEEKARDRQTDIKSYSDRDREIHHGEKGERVGWGGVSHLQSLYPEGGQG